MKQVEIIEKKEGNKVTISLVGSIKSEGDKTKIVNSINKNLEEGVKNFVFDFSQLTYMNSSGVGVFSYFYDQIVRKHEGTFVICSPQERVYKLFEITNLVNILDIRDKC